MTNLEVESFWLSKQVTLRRVLGDQRVFWLEQVPTSRECQYKFQHAGLLTQYRAASIMESHCLKLITPINYLPKPETKYVYAFCIRDTWHTNSMQVHTPSYHVNTQWRQQWCLQALLVHSGTPLWGQSWSMPQDSTHGPRSVHPEDTSSNQDTSSCPDVQVPLYLWEHAQYYDMYIILLPQSVCMPPTVCVLLWCPIEQKSTAKHYTKTTNYTVSQISQANCHVVK